MDSYFDCCFGRDEAACLMSCLSGFVIVTGMSGFCWPCDIAVAQSKIVHVLFDSHFYASDFVKVRLNYFVMAGGQVCLLQNMPHKVQTY